MWQHEYNKWYVIQPGEHFHTVLIDYAVLSVIFMSVVLISARFPEPGNLVTMLTLDVPPLRTGHGFCFCKSRTIQLPWKSQNECARMGHIWSAKLAAVKPEPEMLLENEPKSHLFELHPLLHTVFTPYYITIPLISSGVN